MADEIASSYEVVIHKGQTLRELLDELYRVCAGGVPEDAEVTVVLTRGHVSDHVGLYGGGGPFPIGEGWAAHPEEDRDPAGEIHLAWTVPIAAPNPPPPAEASPAARQVMARPMHAHPQYEAERYAETMRVDTHTADQQAGRLPTASEDPLTQPQWSIGRIPAGDVRDRPCPRRKEVRTRTLILGLIYGAMVGIAWALGWALGR